MKEPISFFPSENPVQLDCELNLDTIYRTNRERNEFENRLDAFLRADEDARSIYELDGNRLRYKTENLVPPKIDGRNPLLLIFGNPASHSVSSGMFFSPKRDGEEHRFWKHLLNTDEIRGLSLGKELSRLERNKKRLELILKGEYESAFIIGLCVYISMPSSAVVGVAGVRKLLGKKAFDMVAAEEVKRVSKEAANFLQPDGLGIVFQKDAWKGLSSSENYTLEEAMAGRLQSSFKGFPEIPIFGIPPTRLLGPSRDVLRRVLSEKAARGR